MKSTQEVQQSKAVFKDETYTRGSTVNTQGLQWSFLKTAFNLGQQISRDNGSNTDKV